MSDFKKNLPQEFVKDVIEANKKIVAEVSAVKSLVQISLERMNAVREQDTKPNWFIRFVGPATLERQQRADKLLTQFVEALKEQGIYQVLIDVKLSTIVPPATL